MAQENLYNLVNKTTSSENRQGKVQIGYTVDTYKGVLAALQQAQEVSRGSGGSVFGDDYSGLQDLRFDNNNFSENTDACLWRMEMGLMGSLPVEFIEAKKFGIVPVRGNNQSTITHSGCSEQLPMSLADNPIGTDANSLNFVAGCFVDVDNHLVTYMNKFFTGTMSEFTWTQDICQRLIQNKCLVAQIIPAGGGASAEVLVVGKTNVTGSRINVSPAAIASGNLATLGLTVTVSGQGIKETLLPSGSGKYSCPIQGKTYKTDTGFIQDFNHAAFRKWKNNNVVDSGLADAIEIDQLEGKSFHVRIYIPSSKRQIAQTIIPSGLPDKLYQTYSAARYGEGNVPAGVNADVKKMMDAITAACVKFNCKLFTANDVKDARGCPTAMGSDGSWIGARGRSTAMAGSFFIPNGWPMCKIIQNYGGRSASDQREKGHPGQTGSTPVDWVIPDSPDRLDDALNSLDAATLSGTKDRAWYQARIEKANKGCIKIHCNSKTADKFQQFFNGMWDIYKEAATIYNTGRPAEEHTSAGEILLRCAPCLCAINGQSGFHRSRKNDKGQWREAGHDGGSAIDFDPSHNGTTASKDVNCNQMEIGKHMEVGYRPMLHMLYKLGGGWGGSYKFCSGKFDAMHVQF